MKQSIYAKQTILCFFLASFLLLLSSCFLQPSLVGTWKLTSGRFNYGTQSYDAFDDPCALEFTKTGEYIIHEGYSYSDTWFRGSYTQDRNQLILRIENMFNFSANYSIQNNRLQLVTSGGTATFEKVNLKQSATPFPAESFIHALEGEGYEVVDAICSVKTDSSCEYRYTLKRTYKYMDTEFLRICQYEFSPFDRLWYLTSSEDTNVIENWHIIGLWKQVDKTTDYLDTLYITSFNPPQATIHFESPSWTSAYAYEFSGSIDVVTFTEWDNEKSYRIYLETDYGRQWGTLAISRDEGVTGIGTKYAYYGSSQTSTNNSSQSNATSSSKPSSTSSIIGKTCRITDPGANVRSGPGTNYNKLGQAPQWNSYEILNCILSDDTETDWYQINFNGQKAWISSVLVELDGNTTGTKNGKPISASVSGPFPIGEFCYTEDDGNNIRSGPGTEYSIVGVANARDGGFLIVDSKPGSTGKDWYKIQLKDGTYGWISSGIVIIDTGV